MSYNINQLKYMLLILLNNDIRVSCCTLHRDKDIYQHDENRCARCVAIKIINDKQYK